MEAYQVLEQKWAEWAGVENVVACSSGTAALHLAFEAMMSFCPSDRRRVIVPDFSMIACPRAVTLAGLVPIFGDCGKDLNLDVNSVRTDWGKVHAILAVHIYGRRCNMEAIHEIADEHNIYVVEDLAEGHGIKPHPKTDAACWSFYKNKVVAGEEGGAVTFKSAMHAKDARSLRSLGFTDEHDFMHIPRGHNYRLANCLAELILSNLNHVDRYVQGRRDYERAYNEHCPIEWKMSDREVPWVYDLRIPGMKYGKQYEVVKTLKSRVQARHAFKPCSIQQEYHSIPTPIWQAHHASQEVIYLPLTPAPYFAHPEAQASWCFETIHKIISQSVPS